MFIPQGNKAGQPLKAPCRPGFSQNFYTMIVSRDLLHGQSILKGKPFVLLTGDIFSSIFGIIPYSGCVPGRVAYITV